ncbi:MAG: TSUP family transporter, partial [Anaerolineaceae bacterium]
MLVSIVSLPIQEAIVINLIVLGLSALMLALRQWPVLNSVREDWPRLIIPSILGGVLGRLLALKTGAPILLLVLGIYAILVGLRLVLIKPMPEREGKAHSNWLIPVEFLP